jgi:DNA-binding NtrC family response regulator
LNLIGASPLFLAACRLVQRLAPCTAPVLVQGETGTGKELFARAIHYLSERRGGPFVPVNCGALPDTLLESELFGHVRGAFTDARQSRQGLIAQARGGTLFLDELEALSPRGQVVLLRFLQDQEYRPVGGEGVRAADVRVVGATNAPLQELAARGEYRDDLLFRLNVLALELPPLREREDDVVLLARTFLTRLARQHSRPTPALHSRTLAFLRSHAWPGNVRELENLIYREFLLSEGPVLDIRAAASGAGERRTALQRPASDRNDALTAVKFRVAKARAVESFERAYLTELLGRTQGNITLAARLAGKERSRFSKLIRKYGFHGETFRSGC